MTAETVTSSVTATRPPFDPELEAVLPMIRAAMPPMRPDALEESRRLEGHGGDDRSYEGDDGQDGCG